MSLHTQFDQAIPNNRQFTTEDFAAEYDKDKRPLPSEYFQGELGVFVEGANQLANQLLAPKEVPYNGHVVIRNHYYCYTPVYTPWYVSRPVIYHSGCHGRGGRENNDVAAVLLGIIASIGLLVASYAVGSAVTSHNDANRELNETKDFQKKLGNHQNYAENSEYPRLQEAARAVKLKERICSRIKNSSAWDLALRMTLAVGLALTAVGAFAFVPPVLALGIAFTIASAASIFLKWGIESADKSNIRDAHSLKASLIRLKQL